MPNLHFITEHSVEEFIQQQKKRIEWLELTLKHFDDGRSKSLYCIAATLLSIPDLEKSLKNSEQEIKADGIGLGDAKAGARILKGFLDNIASREKIESRLRKKERANDGK